MFNTNDIVRWREDGSLETFGRGDDQVKIKVSFYYPTLERELKHPGISSGAGRRLRYYREV
jgi:non-ribosomal peptide synthetase component F